MELKIWINGKNVLQFFLWRSRMCSFCKRNSVHYKELNLHQLFFRKILRNTLPKRFINIVGIDDHIHDKLLPYSIFVCFWHIISIVWMTVTDYRNRCAIFISYHASFSLNMRKISILCTWCEHYNNTNHCKVLITNT